MKILVACEESQRVTIECRKLGHEAYSCDIQSCSGGYPEWHLQQDVIPLLNDDWDMIIAFPPCTHLCVSGARYFEDKIKEGKQQQGIDFFMAIAKANCQKIAIENPVGIMSTVWRKPDQIIQPYYFGDEAQKTTCLWLKGLPSLRMTKRVDKGEFTVAKSGKVDPKWHTETRTLSSKERSKVRSKTFPGIAKAMAEQWTNLSDFNELLSGMGIL
jgi:hypothetical protein